jgi:FkbM family methyltransferase
MEERLRKALGLLEHPRLLRAYLRHGVAASLEHRSLPAGQYATVVDIGAHTGQFSLLVRELYPEAAIHAFEPLPAAAAKFREVFADDPQVTLHEAAIAPEPGRATFFQSGVWDAGSLLPSAFGSADELSVAAGRLEDFIQAEEIAAPALLKLDVQGYEREALGGCASLLDRFDVIVAELNLTVGYVGQALAGDVIAFLRETGFQLTGIDAIGREDGEIVRFDGIFQRVNGSAQASGAD